MVEMLFGWGRGGMVQVAGGDSMQVETRSRSWTAAKMVHSKQKEKMKRSKKVGVERIASDALSSPRPCTRAL